MPPFILKSILEFEVDEISIIDIGAMLEGVPRYESLTKNYSTQTTAFEPDKIQYEKLLQSGNSAINYLPFFIGIGGESIFHIAQYPGCSSLYEADPEVINMFTSIGASEGGNFTVTKKIPVKTVRLDDVYELPHAHYIKIDVQGGELDVLRGACHTLSRTLVLEIEVEFVPLYKDQPLFGDIQCFLRDQGFVFHKFVDIAGRCFRPMKFEKNPCAPMSQTLWSDGIFIRDFTRFHELTDTEILIMATIMHDVYLSYDLTNLLLAIYDKRNKTKLKSNYLQKLRAVPELKFLYLSQRLQA